MRNRATEASQTLCIFRTLHQNKIYVALRNQISTCTYMPVSSPCTCKQEKKNVPFKYWDTWTPYHTGPKIWTSPLYYMYILMHLKYCWMSCKQCRPWSDATFWGVSSGSTLFVQACLFWFSNTRSSSRQFVQKALAFQTFFKISWTNKWVCTR